MKRRLRRRIPTRSYRGDSGRASSYGYGNDNRNSKVFPQMDLLMASPTSVPNSVRGSDSVKVDGIDMDVDLPSPPEEDTCFAQQEGNNEDDQSLALLESLTGLTPAVDSKEAKGKKRFISKEQPAEVATATAPKKPPPRKKSKGRNGNVYIGVFNRIEWMKLQEEFGFQTVNNFGTFVLQTMRRVHGDIQFWCDVAKASGVYPDLSHYEWKNGFPHAVNNEGENFTPEMGEISEGLREVLGDMARKMWEERLEVLKQQQQLPIVADMSTVPEELEEAV